MPHRCPRHGNELLISINAMYPQYVLFVAVVCAGLSPDLAALTIIKSTSVLTSSSSPAGQEGGWQKKETHRRFRGLPESGSRRQSMGRTDWVPFSHSPRRSRIMIYWTLIMDSELKGIQRIGFQKRRSRNGRYLIFKGFYEVRTWSRTQTKASKYAKRANPPPPHTHTHAYIKSGIWSWWRPTGVTNVNVI